MVDPLSLGYMGGSGTIDTSKAAPESYQRDQALRGPFAALIKVVYLKSGTLKMCQK